MASSRAPAWNRRSGKLVSWRLQLRPWLWLLTRRSDNRIFQNMTVEAIIKEVFEKYTGVTVDWQLQGSFAPRLYCVQYRETDFNFVSRLMEEEGMYYFHRHAAAHTRWSSATMTTHDEVTGFGTKHQVPRARRTRCSTWRPSPSGATRYELSSGKVTLTDYDYLKPATSLKVDHSSASPRAGGAGAL
jgi:type VI secretion system secreted protein VgrG